MVPFLSEEAVNDVKRQAMLELQKAVSAADQKAADLVAAERVKMERAVADARKQAHADVVRSLTLQEESAEVNAVTETDLKIFVTLWKMLKI